MLFVCLPEGTPTGRPRYCIVAGSGHCSPFQLHGHLPLVSLGHGTAAPQGNQGDHRYTMNYDIHRYTTIQKINDRLQINKGQKKSSRKAPCFAVFFMDVNKNPSNPAASREAARLSTGWRAAVEANLICCQVNHPEFLAIEMGKNHLTKNVTRPGQRLYIAIENHHFNGKTHYEELIMAMFQNANC